MRPTTKTVLFCTLLLAQPAWAQSEAKNPPTKNPPSKETKKPDPSKKAKAVDSEKAGERFVPDAMGFRNRGLIDEQGNPIDSRADGKMTAGQIRRARDARNQPDPSVGNAVEPMRGGHLFSPVVHLRPRRLAPGERGVLHVVVTLGEAGHVVLASSVAELRLVGDSPLLKLGAPLLGKARIGRAAKKFKGKPVYEDTLNFEVPITIGASAVAREYAVKGVVRLFLHDGSSGDPQGLFVADVVGSVRVGASLQARESLAAARSKRVERGLDEAQPVSGEALSTSEPRPIDTKSVSRGGGAMEGVAQGSRGMDSANPGEAPAETGSNVLYWVFGAVAVLGLLVILRRSAS